MRRLNRLALSLAICGGLAISGGTARTAPPTTKPAAGAADENEPLVSKMRVQDFPATHYYFASAQTTLVGIGGTVQELMPKIVASFEENKIRPTGPSVFVYQGMTGDPNKEFTLEIGFPVAEGTKDAGDFKVRELPAFHCATVIYSGPVAQVREAYQQVFTEIMTAGLTPTGETREMYLYWEGIDSPNNVELIMIGVQN